MTQEWRTAVWRFFVLAVLPATIGASATGACGRTDLYSRARGGGRAGADGGMPADAGTGGGTPAGTGGAPGTGGALPGTGGARPPCGPLIDDMEDGSGRVCAGAGRVGVWYAFNDGLGTQWPAPTTPGLPIETSPIPGGRGDSHRAMHTYGQKMSSWGGGIGVDLAFDGTTYGLYDARAYDGITFWARSEPQLSEIHVRISTASSALTGYDGTCTSYPICPTPAESVVMPTSEWRQYWVPFSQLHVGYPLPLEADKVINVQFLVRDGGNPFDFWIDDLSFYTGQAGCCPSPAAAPPGCQGAIAFDIGIEGVVRMLAGKPDGDVTCSDVCSIYSMQPYVFPYGSLFETLDGLQCLTGLGSLAVAGTSLTDIGALAGLTQLRRLILNQNQISDLTPLHGLARLIELNLSYNHVHDLRPLSGLGALALLNVANNDIEWGPADDLTPLDGLDGLQELDLSMNHIQSVAPLARLTALPKLELWNNQIEDVTPLRGLHGLVNLTLSSNDIADVQPLAGLTTLPWLDLSRNQIADVTPLSAMTGLTSLTLSGNPVGALGSLAALPNLAALYLDSCHIGRVDALSTLSTLTTLSLNDNEILDIAPLSRLAGLAGLQLSSNLINDLTPLTGLTHLTLVNLQNNRIQTLAPLDANPGLATGATIYLAGNPIDCQAQAPNIAALRSRGVVIDPQPSRGSSPAACP
jgi:internalin A